MAIRSQITRSSVRRSGSVTGSGGVDKIIPGTGIGVSPGTGTGNVTVSNTGVITATAGTGLTNSGSATNPVFNATAVGTVTSLVSASPGVVITNPTGPVVTEQQNIVADWVTGVARVYGIDFVNGLDANKGFADPASPSTADYETACTAAGAAAKKTIAGLAAIFPRNGAGRNVEIVIRNGGVNTEQAYTDALDVLLGGCVGWNTFGLRATGTNTTAGCVAFDGSVADVTYQGGITVPTLNVAGYNPNGATTTSLPCVLAGGGAAGLPAEPNPPLGWRVRFDAATATVALRNQCRQIAQVAAVDTITPQTAFTAAPANTDVFYIEQSGVTYPASTIGFGSGGQGVSQFTEVFGLSGLRCTGALVPVNAAVRMAFCGTGTLNLLGNDLFLVAQTYQSPCTLLGLLTVGGGLHCTTNATFNATGQILSLRGLVCQTSATFLTTNQPIWTNGCYCGTVLTAQELVMYAAEVSGASPSFGSATALAGPRAQRMSVLDSRITLGGLTLAGAGANPAIKVNGFCEIAFSQAVAVSGTTGNTDVGLDLTASRNSLIIIITTPTVTGALGDIRLAGGQIISWANAVATGIVDSAGNRIIGVGAPPLGWTHFSGAILGGAGATVSYLADAGIIGAVNQTTAFRRATSLRLMLRLRVTSISNTSANAVTCTLFKNGVATTMLVSIPAATAANTKFVDSAHPILFADGDDLDLRLDDAADVGGVVNVSAALEWAA